jgi:hypothetical protein
MTTEVEDDAYLAVTFSFHNMNEAPQDKEAHQKELDKAKGSTSRQGEEN